MGDTHMTIAFIADCHIGNHQKCAGETSFLGMNSRCMLTIKALEDAYIKAKSLEVRHIVICGDLFDNPRPTPQMVEAVQRIVDTIPTTILIGNHDRVSDSEKHYAEAPLWPVADIVDKPVVKRINDIPIMCIPFRRNSASKWLPTVVADLAKSVSGTAALAVHLGIRDENSASFLQEADDAIDVGVLRKLMRHFGISNVFAGNWHDHKVWSLKDVGTVVQCGALAPTGWNNPGLTGYGRLVLFNGSSIAAHEIAGPRFIDSETIPLMQLKKLKEHGHTVYIKLNAKPDSVSELSSKLEEVRSCDLIAGWDVAVDRRDADTALKNAAVQVKSSDTLDVALKKHIATLKLPNSVTEQEILERTKGFLQ